MLNFGASKPRVKGGPAPPEPPLDPHLKGSPWTETPLGRDHLDRDLLDKDPPDRVPADRDPSQTETPWTEIPQAENPRTEAPSCPVDTQTPRKTLPIVSNS